MYNYYLFNLLPEKTKPFITLTQNDPVFPRGSAID